MLIYQDDKWFAGRATSDGVTLLVRARALVPPRADRDTWDQLVIVKWSFAATEAGMPTPAENERAIAFEQAVDAELAADQSGLLAAVVTGAGIKEWRYYTPDPDGFTISLNRARAREAQAPIEVTGFFDEGWSALAELLPGGASPP